VIPTSVAPILSLSGGCGLDDAAASWAEPGVSSGLSHGRKECWIFCGSAARLFLPISCVAREAEGGNRDCALGVGGAGLVTADGFDNLRSLIDPKRRAGQGSGRTTRPRHNAGRWALLHADEVVERPRAVEAACWMLLRRYGM